MRARHGLLLIALLSQAMGLVGLFSATPVAAQQSADQVVLDLNHGAMDAYNNMDINRAGSMLEEALRIAQQNRVPAPLYAQTNVNMAIIYIGGLGDNDGGVKYFIDALCADPNVQLDPLTSTPDIQSVFQVAVSRVQQQGCAGGAAPNIAPGAAAGTMPMGPRPGPVQGPPAGGGDEVPARNVDEELPPGWGQTDPNAGKAKDFKRAFFQLGFALGMPWISPGMEADREPAPSQVFIHSENGGQIADPQAFIDADPKNAQFLRFPGSQITKFDEAGNDLGITQQNAWEPDQDSYDGYVNAQNNPEPFSQSSCKGDGTDTGPPLGGRPRDAGLFPSKYCVRVNKPGFAPELALRAAIGYFITRDVSLALLMRLQFSAGQGTFSNMLLGARAEYMFTRTKPRGLMISGFLGGTFGQIQAKPSASGATGGEPWIKSGLGGAHIGSNIRYRFTDNIGMFMSPELDIQFPSFLWNIDLTVLGVELAI